MNYSLTNAKSITVVTLSLMCAFESAYAGLVVEAQATPTYQSVVPSVVPPSIAGQGAIMFKHRKQVDMDSVVTAQISQAGVRPTELPPIKGAGHGVSIAEAMGQLLPLGWKLFSDVEINSDVRLNWTGGRNWVLLVNSVLVDANLNAFIDWSAREVTLTQSAGGWSVINTSAKVTASAASGPENSKATPKSAATTMAPLPAAISLTAPSAAPLNSVAPGETVLSQQDIKLMVNELAEARKARESSAQSALKPLPTPLPQMPAPSSMTSSTATPVVHTIALAAPTQAEDVSAKVWRLNEDLSIRENFEVMTKKEGWRLVWSARKGDRIYDYPATYLGSIEFKGELTGNTGVMARIITAYASSSPALEIHFYTKNRVAEVVVHRVAADIDTSSMLKAAGDVKQDDDKNNPNTAE